MRLRSARQPCLQRGGSPVGVGIGWEAGLDGALGHAAASVLGRDLKKLLDRELVRMKTHVETGRPPHDAAGSSATIGVE